MEKDFVRSLDDAEPAVRAAAQRRFDAPVRLADPIDITKMLNIPPGTKELPGVARTLSLFYPLSDG